MGEEEEDDDEPDERGIPRATRIEPQKRSHPDEDQRRPKQKPAANQAPPAAATKRATATAAGTTAVTKSAAVAGGAVSRGQKKSKKATKTMDPGIYMYICIMMPLFCLRVLQLHIVYAHVNHKDSSIVLVR